MFIYLFYSTLIQSLISAHFLFQRMTFPDIYPNLIKLISEVFDNHLTKPARVYTIKRFTYFLFLFCWKTV